MAALGKSQCVRVLGVDPAAAGPTGYAIVECNGRDCRSLRYGALKVAGKIRKESAGAALQAVHSLVCDLLREFCPQALAVAQHGVAVHSYAPRLIKASIAGYGHADKRQLQLMVRSILRLEEIPEPADAADALAVALCHLQSEQFRARFGIPAETSRPAGRLRPAPSPQPRRSRAPFSPQVPLSP